MARVILVTSGKGGVGKTVTAINLGVSLNLLNNSVVVVDANLSTPNVGLHLGAPIVPVSLNHVLKGKTSISDAIYEHSSGTKIVPSSLSVKEVRSFDMSRFPESIKELSNLSDFVIIDSAAGFGDEVLTAMDVADEILVVTNPEMPAVTDALKVVKVAKERNRDINGVIVTRYANKRYEMSLHSIKSMLESPIIGVIPEDKAVKDSINLRNAVVQTHPRSKASRKYFMIAKKICGDDYEERGFFRRLFGL